MTDIHWFSQNQKVQAEASIIVTPVLFWLTQCEKLYLLPLKTCLCCSTELFEKCAWSQSFNQQIGPFVLVAEHSTGDKLSSSASSVNQNWIGSGEKLDRIG